MMDDISNEFTPEELEDLGATVSGYIGSYDGLMSPAKLDRMHQLEIKIKRLRLIGKKVIFLHNGEELRGELRVYKDWEGILMAQIGCNGNIYLVGVERDLLGEVGETPRDTYSFQTGDLGGNPH